MDIHIRPLDIHVRSASRASRHGVNLLEALRANGVPVSYSCMAGRCGTCRCKVVSGQVLESGREVRHAQAGDDPNSVLACQTFVTEPCTVEIPEPDEVVVHTARIVKATVVAIEDAHARHPAPAAQAGQADRVLARAVRAAAVHARAHPARIPWPACAPTASWSSMCAACRMAA